MNLMDEQGVPVRYVGMGAVLIGDEPVAPSGSVAIQLPGAVINIDPARPDLTPSCLVADSDMACAVIGQLYGEAMAQTMLGMRTGQREVMLCREVTAGPILGVLRRLAEVRWCQWHTLLPMTSPLLELEELTLLGRLVGVVADDEDWRDRLLRQVESLTATPGSAARILERKVGRKLIDTAFATLAAEPGEPAPSATVTRLEPIPGSPFREVVTRTMTDWAATLWPEFARRSGDHEKQGVWPDPCQLEAHRLTCAGVAALRLYAVTPGQAFRDAALGALTYAAEGWGRAGCPREAGTVARLLAVADSPGTPSAWRVSPTAAERFFAEASEQDLVEGALRAVAE